MTICFFRYLLLMSEWWFLYEIFPLSRRRWRAKCKPRIKRQMRPSGRNLPRWCGVTGCNNPFGCRRCPSNPEHKTCILLKVVIYQSQTWRLQLNYLSAGLFPPLRGAYIGKRSPYPISSGVFVLASSHAARYGAYIWHATSGGLRGKYCLVICAGWLSCWRTSLSCQNLPQ